MSVNDVDSARRILDDNAVAACGRGHARPRLDLRRYGYWRRHGHGDRSAGTAAAINAAIATITYTPTADYNGTTTLTVSTSDGIAAATVNTVGITVTAVADIANDSVTTNEDAPVTFAPLGNDSFENAGRTITAINGSAITAGGPAVVLAGVGTVTLDTSGNLTFTPVANYNGTPSFTYTVSSGGVTETATVNLTVTAVNDAPTQTVPVAQTTAEDTVKVISGASVADVDGGTLTTTLTIPAARARLTFVTGGGATISGAGTATVTISRHGCADQRRDCVDHLHASGRLQRLCAADHLDL